MRTFNVWNLAKLLYHIDHALEVIKPMAQDATLRDERLADKDLEMWISPNIMLAESLAKEICLESTHDRVWQGGGPFWIATGVGLSWQEAYSQLRYLREAIEATWNEAHLFSSCLIGLRWRTTPAVCGRKFGRLYRIANWMRRKRFTVMPWSDISHG